MRRRTFFRNTVQVVAGASFLSTETLRAAATEAASTDVPFAFASAPVLLNATGDGVSVICALNGPGTGWVEYGETEALGQLCDGAVQGFLPFEAKALRFRLEGLKPGKEYFYRVHAVAVKFETAYKVHRGAAVTTPIRSFRTLNPAAETASFTVWNDTHQNKETLRQLIALHRQEPGDFLVWNGDITNDVTTEQLLIDEYLNPAGEAYADSTPLFFSRGNHDVRGEAARLLADYAPGLGGAYHYVFRQGPVGCLVMDTGEDKPDETPTYAGLNDFAAHRTAQRHWLERAIQDPAFSSAPFKIAIMHIPLVWDGDVPPNWPSVWGGHHGWVCEDGRRKWHDLLEKAGIRLIISGHTHCPAWFPPNAEHSYAQFTGGGPKPEQATILRLHADAKEMRVRVTDLTGRARFDEKFTAG
ncbi:MAG: metallophosphoesterase [Chthoniobacteraceae bacterium]